MAHDVLSDDERRARYDETGEFDQGQPDNDTGRAIEIISRALDEVLRNYGGQRAVLMEDVMALVRQVLAAQKRPALDEIAKLDSAIEVNRWFVGRFKAAGERNIMEDLIRVRIVGFEQRRQQAEAVIAMIEDAEARLDGYTFQRDPLDLSEGEMPGVTVCNTAVWR